MVKLLKMNLSAVKKQGGKTLKRGDVLGKTELKKSYAEAYFNRVRLKSQLPSSILLIPDPAGEHCLDAIGKLIEKKSLKDSATAKTYDQNFKIISLKK